MAPGIRIHLKNWNPNTFSPFSWNTGNPFNCLEYINGYEYEYISFLASEYEYIYPLLWEKSIWAHSECASCSLVQMVHASFS